MRHFRLIIIMVVVCASACVWANDEQAQSSSAHNLAHIRMSGEILHSPPPFTLFGDGEYMTLQDWLHRLAQARNDPRVTAIALDIDSPEISLAQAQELADAVSRLSEFKPVYAYLNSPRAPEHIIASAATKIHMDEADMLNIVGVGAEMFFFGRTLDRIGIEPQVVQIGTYKGASEPITRREPSDALKEQYDWLLDDLYDQLIERISVSRGLTRQQTVDAIDAGPLDGAGAVERGMIDGLASKADWLEQIAQNVVNQEGAYGVMPNYGRKESSQIDASNPLTLLNSLLRARAQPEIKDPSIAIIHVDGIIVSGEGGETLFGQRMAGASSIMGAFREATENDGIKAVILRVDSPGGSALASEQIYQAARKCAQTKPVITSIGQVGASGGYYIALGAEIIIADASSITGSIGVVSAKIAFTDLLDRIGVGRYETLRGANAGMWLSRPWTQREMKIIEKHAQNTYELFLHRVRDSRGTRVTDMHAVTQGRIFTARQAVNNGLVDRVGGLRDAVVLAEQSVGVSDAAFIVLPRTRSLADVLSGREPTGPLGLPGAFAPAEEMLGLHAPARHAAGYMLGIIQCLRTENVLLAMPEYVYISN